MSDTVMTLSKIQFTLHIEHSVFPYEIPTGECCEEKQLLFMLRSVLNTYRVDHEKVARLPFAFEYCINFCIYDMLRTRVTFSWPTL